MIVPALIEVNPRVKHEMLSDSYRTRGWRDDGGAGPDTR
jgi:hypothetical protein